MDFHRENEIIQTVLASAICVHQELGPGLLESVYEGAMAVELRESGLLFQRQVPVPVTYKGCEIGTGFRADIIVERQLLLELKVVNELVEEHVSQVVTYLKLMDLKRGYLLNFGKKLMRDGIKRVSR
ncbi:MAG: GxxExxY protein [Candidatus Sericytochromatia bacterium]